MAHDYLSRGMVVRIKYHHSNPHSRMNGVWVVIRANLAEVWYSRLNTRKLELTLSKAGKYDYTVHRWDKDHTQIIPMKYALLHEYMPLLNHPKTTGNGTDGNNLPQGVQ